jgi:2-oxoglutarate/2-oxoacid ferredoxin oxidoreductase subunit alpha
MATTAPSTPGPVAAASHTHTVPVCTLEIVSDSGEGAQKCAQIFGIVSAKMGNGVWTVEIIPAEIQPPARSPAGASGNRIRIGTGEVTNWGDETNLIVAFNEQVLMGRVSLGALADDATVLVADEWATHPDPKIRGEWDVAMAELATRGYRVITVPLEAECKEVVEDPRKGKNMFALGMLAWIFDRDVERMRAEIVAAFAKKSDEVHEKNLALFERGLAWASSNLDFRYDVRPSPRTQPTLVLNGNQAVALGAIAAGFDLMSMYPITPATSVTHYLADIFERFGGMVHQAEDEIAAVGVAIGASYAGRCALTVTSGPGLALKTEFLGLAVMTETPLVVVDVQRGGPSTGLPTKVEQSDLLAALFASPGDAPKIVIAPSTIEECFHSMITARRLADAFRCLVMVLTDANLATGVQPFPRPVLDPAWQGAAPDLAPVPDGAKPYGWDARTGLSRRIVPGQPAGMHTVTGLAHDENSKVAYDSAIHQRGSTMRSRKLAVLQQMLKPPAVNGDADGELLVVGWGSTRGAIEEAVERVRAEGHSVSSLHLTFLSPLEPGLAEILRRYRRVMTVEINYSDDPDDPFITAENRRYGQLAWLLRAHTLVDIDCWTRVIGEPLRPGAIARAIRSRLNAGGAA